MTRVKSQVCPSLSIFFTNWQTSLLTHFLVKYIGLSLSLSPHSSISSLSLFQSISSLSLSLPHLVQALSSRSSLSLSPPLSPISSKLRKLVNTAQKSRRRSSVIVGGAFRMSAQKKRSCNPRNKTLGSFFFSFFGYKISLSS